MNIGFLVTIMKLLVLCFIQISYGIAREWKPEDLNAVSFIQYNGYEAETHTVTTKDGYSIKMHRIPHNRVTNVICRPVFLQHGLNSASDTLVMRTPDKDLAYILSDAGYDVWLGNSRGNPYAPGFVDASNTTFWDFSFHEMGVFDLSTEIDYILDRTGYPNLSYIGHSLGTTIAFVLLSEEPKYNSKINVFIGFGSTAFLLDSWQFQKSDSKIIGRLSPILNRLLGDRMNHFHKGQDMRTEAKILKVFEEFGENSPTKEEAINRYMGYKLVNEEQTETEFILPIQALRKSGTSVKLLIHLCQNAVSDKFRKFDYGKTKNIKLYGVKKPPEYNLKSITTPVALYVAKNDEVASLKSSQRLARELKNLYRFYIVNDDKFNHIDFIYGKDAKSLVYNDVLKVLSECIDKEVNCNLSSKNREELNIKFSSTTITT